MKYNNRLLSIVFAVLLAFVLINEWAFSSRKSDTIDKSFSVIVPEEVGKIEIFPKSESKKPYHFARVDSGWKLQRENLSVAIDPEKPIGLMNMLQTLDIQGLASLEKDSWASFELSDSASSEVKVYDQGGQVILHLYGGKTGLIQGEKISYVRELGEDAVYAIKGPLAEEINKTLSAWRDNKVSVYLFPKQVVQVSFTYPGDSSYTLSQNESKWYMGEEEADSVAASNYINLISNLTSDAFADDFEAKGKAPYRLIVQRNTGEPFTIEGYTGKAPGEYFLKSSLNEESFFQSKEDGLFGKLFVPSSRFKINQE